MKVQNNKMKLKLKENENELEIISENDLFQPKFFFEVSTDTIFYNETEYFHFLESCISNLQFLFKISKQKSLSFLQKNNYDLCETIKELNELKKKNMDEKYVVQQTNNSEKNLLEVDFCLICEESKPQQFGIECSHKFCEECYKNYLKAIMENKGFLCFPAKCPMEGCNCAIEIDSFEVLFKKDKKIMEKIKQYFQLFVKNTQPQNIKHCPNPNCEYIYKLPQELSSHELKIDCPNNHAFCHKCHNAAHFPFNCNEYQLWFYPDSNLYKKDSLWIIKFCKKCPKCNWYIQKNEGCNHMTCRLCNHQFCWLCFQDYEKHNASICSKLTLERKVKKEKLVKISTNYLKKNDLMKSKVDFDNQQKLQSDKILTKLKKQKANQKDNIDFFKTCEEIEEFLFLASKISFVFSTFSEKEELIKKTKASLINSIMRLKITRKKEPMMKSLLIKNLKFYCKIIEMNLNKARNDKDLLENFF